MSILTITTMRRFDKRVAALVVPLLRLFVYVRHRYRNILRRVADHIREAMGRHSRYLFS